MLIIDSASSASWVPLPWTDRDDLPRRAPRALDERQQKRYLRAVERRLLVRDLPSR